MVFSSRDFRQTASPVFVAVVLVLAIFIPSFAARADDTPCVESTGEEAIAACTREIGAGSLQDRQLAALYLSRGEAYSSRYDIGAALADFSQAIRLNPQFAAAYDARGRAYHFLPDRALLDFNIALKLDPQFVRALVDRGAAYRLTGDLDRSRADLDEAIHLAPDNAHAYEVRGAVYRDKGEFDHAISDYSEAVRRNPKNYLAFFDRGRVYQRLGQIDAAIADYDQAIRLGPSTRAYEVRGGAYQAKGNLEAAIRDFDAAIRRTPDDVTALQARGTARLAAGDSLGGNADLAEAKRLTTTAGLSNAFARLHAIFGLLALISGAVMLIGMMRAKYRPRWTMLFFVTAGLTDAGVLWLHDVALMRDYPFGLCALALLLTGAFSFYVRGAERHWRWVFVIASITALFLNVQVAAQQLFLTLPFLMRLMPLDPTPVFFAEPLLLTALFLCTCIAALCRYRPVGDFAATKEATDAPQIS
jgi:tetratricopeptide (TPR) repeat protein